MSCADWVILEVPFTLFEAFERCFLPLAKLPSTLHHTNQQYVLPAICFYNWSNHVANLVCNYCKHKVITGRGDKVLIYLLINKDS